MDKILIVSLLLLFSPVILSLYEVLNLNCAGVASDAIMYTWNRPADPSRVVQGYKLDLERTDGLVTEVVPTLDINDYYTENFTFSNLGSYAVYTLSIYTYTTSGNEPTQTVTCRSNTGVPYQAPDQVEAVGISYTEISVNWTEIAEKDRGGILAGYKIVYYKYVSSYKTYITVSNTTTQHTITGLDFDTHYLVGVIAFTSAGDGPVTTDTNKTLGLPTKPPDTVRKYYCYEAIPGMLVLDWDEMPCTVYVGIMGGLLALNLLFLFCCIMQCMKKPDPEDDQDRDGRRDDYPDSESDDEGRGPWRTKGNITTRDIIIRSPSPTELPPAYDASYLKPKQIAKVKPMTKKMPKVGKNITAENKAKDEKHYEDAKARGVLKDDDDDPRSQKSKGKVEPLDLSGLASKDGKGGKKGHVNNWIAAEGDDDTPTKSKFGLRSSGKKKIKNNEEDNDNDPNNITEGENAKGDEEQKNKNKTEQNQPLQRPNDKKGANTNTESNSKKGDGGLQKSLDHEESSSGDETDSGEETSEDESDGSGGNKNDNTGISSGGTKHHSNKGRPKFSIGDPMDDDEKIGQHQNDSSNKHTERNHGSNNTEMHETNTNQTKFIIVNGKNRDPKGLPKTKSMTELRRKPKASNLGSNYDDLDLPDTVEYVNCYAPNNYGTDGPDNHGNQYPDNHGNQYPDNHGNQYPDNHGNHAPDNHDNHVTNNHGIHRPSHSAMTKGKYGGNGGGMRISLSSPEFKTRRENSDSNFRIFKRNPFSKNKVDVIPEVKGPKMSRSDDVDNDKKNPKANQNFSPNKHGRNGRRNNDDHSGTHYDTNPFRNVTAPQENGENNHPNSKQNTSSNNRDKNGRRNDDDDDDGMNFGTEPLHYEATPREKRKNLSAYNPFMVNKGGSSKQKGDGESGGLPRKSHSAAQLDHPSNGYYINDDHHPEFTPRRHSNPMDGIDRPYSDMQPTMVKPLYNDSPNSSHNGVPNSRSSAHPSYHGMPNSRSTNVQSAHPSHNGMPNSRSSAHPSHNGMPNSRSSAHPSHNGMPNSRSSSHPSHNGMPNSRLSDVQETSFVTVPPGDNNSSHPYRNNNSSQPFRDKNSSQPSKDNKHTNNGVPDSFYGIPLTDDVPNWDKTPNTSRSNNADTPYIKNADLPPWGQGPNNSRRNDQDSPYLNNANRPPWGNGPNNSGNNDPDYPYSNNANRRPWDKGPNNSGNNETDSPYSNNANRRPWDKGPNNSGNNDTDSPYSNNANRRPWNKGPNNSGKNETDSPYSNNANRRPWDKGPNNSGNNDTDSPYSNNANRRPWDKGPNNSGKNETDSPYSNNANRRPWDKGPNNSGNNDTDSPYSNNAKRTSWGNGPNNFGNDDSESPYLNKHVPSRSSNDQTNGNPERNDNHISNIHPKDRPPSDYSAPPGMALETARTRHLPPSRENQPGHSRKGDKSPNRDHSQDKMKPEDTKDKIPKSYDSDPTKDEPPNKTKPGLKGILKKPSQPQQPQDSNPSTRENKPDYTPYKSGHKPDNTPYKGGYNTPDYNDKKYGNAPPGNGGYNTPDYNDKKYVNAPGRCGYNTSDNNDKKYGNAPDRDGYNKPDYNDPKYGKAPGKSGNKSEKTPGTDDNKPDNTPRTRSDKMYGNPSAPHDHRPDNPSAPHGHGPDNPSEPHGKKPGSTSEPHGQKPDHSSGSKRQKPDHPSSSKGQSPDNPSGSKGQNPDQPSGSKGQKPDNRSGSASLGDIDPDVQVVMKMSQYKKVLGFINKLKNAKGQK